MRLTDRGVKAAKAPGYLPDGGNLYLQVSPSGSKSWLFRYQRDGKERQMGLGSINDLTLAEARERARLCRQQLLDGIDPLEAKHAKKRSAAAATARMVTFKAEAEAFIEANRAGWKNGKHADQWTNTLTTYAYPHIGHLTVDVIDAGMVVKVLTPIWTTKTETASRVRARIESVLDRATALKHRSGDNPARWKGHLDNLLPKPTDVAKVEHHAALPIDAMPQFMADLRQRDSVSARALEFTILCAARTGETLGATWGEIDLDAKTWTVPADRMKAEREHAVPLSRRAVEILTAFKHRKGYVFRNGSKPLSSAAMAELLKGMRPGYTPHGTARSTFTDWSSERTSTPHEVIEMALAHAIDSKAEKAYRRGDLLAKRAKLMLQWADFCAKPPARTAVVVPITAAAAAVA